MGVFEEVTNGFALSFCYSFGRPLFSFTQNKFGLVLWIYFISKELSFEIHAYILFHLIKMRVRIVHYNFFN